MYEIRGKIFLHAKKYFHTWKFPETCINKIVQIFIDYKKKLHNQTFTKSRDQDLQEI